MCSSDLAAERVELEVLPQCAPAPDVSDAAVDGRRRAAELAEAAAGGSSRTWDGCCRLRAGGAGYLRTPCEASVEHVGAQPRRQHLARAMLGHQQDGLGALSRRLVAHVSRWARDEAGAR